MIFRTGLLLLALAMCVDCQDRFFDCRWTGTTCNTGNCRTNAGQGGELGTCDCPPGFTGYDCSYQGTELGAAQCNVVCDFADNRRFCYRPTLGGPDQCVCTSEFTGPTCDIARVATTCSPRSMTVSITPLPGPAFVGQIYVRGFQGQPACAFTAPNAAGTRSLALNLGQCGITTAQNADGDTVYSLFAVVQYSSIFSTIFDQDHEAQCIHLTDGTVEGSINVLPAPTRSGQTVSDVATVTHMEIYRIVQGAPDVQLSPATGQTVFVGDNAELRIILDSDQYVSHYTSSCIADNGVGGVGNQVQLVANGCIDYTNARGIVRPPMTRVGNVITLPIMAFRFDGTDIVRFLCDVRACRTGDDRCDARTNCDSQVQVGTGYGRKKRQSGDEPESRKVEVTFRVVSPSELDQTCAASTHTIESCARSVPFVAVTAIFGVLLLVVLIASVVLCFRSSRTSRRPEGKTMDSGYFNKAMSTA